MEQLLRYLKLAMPYLALAETVARNIDQNDTGADDEIADKLGETLGFLSKLINAASDGKTETAARGYEQIMAFGNNVMSSLDVLRQTDMNTVVKQKEANRIVAMLSDPTLVYQARKGKDADALAHFKKISKESADAINEN